MDARPWQFSIRQAMVVTALVGVACAAGRYVVTGGEPIGRLFAVFAVPLLMGGAVGVLCERVATGLWWGAAVGMGTAILMLVGLTR